MNLVPEILRVVSSRKLSSAPYRNWFLSLGRDFGTHEETEPTSLQTAERETSSLPKTFALLGAVMK